LDQVVRDPKTAAKYDYLYVPAADEVAVKYFQSSEIPASPKTVRPN
jgi:hypothetical protein